MSLDGRHGEAVVGGVLASAQKHRWLVVTSDGYRQRMGAHPDPAAGAKGYIVKSVEHGAGFKVDVFWDNGKLLCGYQACEGVFDLLVAPMDDKEQGEASSASVPLHKRVMGKLRNRSSSATRRPSLSRTPTGLFPGSEGDTQLQDAKLEVIVGYMGKAPAAHKSGGQFTLWDDECPTMKYNVHKPSAPSQPVAQHREPGGGAARLPQQPQYHAPAVPDTQGQPQHEQQAAAGEAASVPRILEQLQVPMPALPSLPPSGIAGYQAVQQPFKAMGTLQQFGVAGVPEVRGGRGSSRSKDSSSSPTSSCRNSDGGDSARLSAASTATDMTGNWDNLLC